MGIEKNVGFDKFPKQRNELGREVNVCFNYDTSKIIKGKIVRDDAEKPSRTIIQLSDGRYILGIECHYSIK